MDIIKIRIARSEIRLFPFDLIYLVPYEQKHILPNLFPWSLCLPPFCALVKKLKCIRDITHINFETYFISIPILPLMSTQQARDAHTKLPGYLIANRHRIHKKEIYKDIYKRSTFPHILTDDVVLFTPNGSYQPVCLHCPRHMLYVLGKCELGCEYCFDSLILQGPTHELLQTNNLDYNYNT